MALAAVYSFDRDLAAAAAPLVRHATLSLARSRGGSWACRRRLCRWEACFEDLYVAGDAVIAIGHRRNDGADAARTRLRVRKFASWNITSMDDFIGI